MPVLIAILLVVALVVAGVVWLARSAKGARTAQVAGLQRLGLEVEEGRRGILATGTIDGHPVRIEEDLLHHRDGTSQRTLLTVDGGAVPVTTYVESVRRAAFAAGAPAGLRQVPAGDASFDRHFRVHTDDPARSAVLTRPGSRWLMLQLGTRGLRGEVVDLHVTRGQVRMTLGHSGLSPDHLHRALALMMDLTRAV